MTSLYDITDDRRTRTMDARALAATRRAIKHELRRSPSPAYQRNLERALAILQTSYDQDMEVRGLGHVH